MNWIRLLTCAEVFLLAVLLLWGCDSGPESTEVYTEETALWLDDEAIDIDVLKSAVKARVDTWAIEGEISEAEFKAILKTTVSELIRERILRKTATEMGVQVSVPKLSDPDEKRDYPEGFETLSSADQSWEDRVSNQVELMLISQELSSRKFGTVSIADEQIKTYYDEHPQRFTIPETYDLRVIRVNDLDLAQDIQQKVRKKWKFTTLAEKYSTLRGDSSKGQIVSKSIGELPTGFVTEIQRLKPGQTSIVLTSLEGYYIYRLIKKHDEDILPFEDVKDSLRVELRMREETRLFEQWLTNEEKTITIRWGTPVPFPGGE